MKNEKAIISAKDYSLGTNRLTMNNDTPTQNNFQLDSAQSPFLETIAFVCDDCARPLSLYGENFIETYTNGEVNILRCLCDLHADEMEVNG